VSRDRLHQSASALGLVGLGLLIASLVYSIVWGIECAFEPPCNEALEDGLAAGASLPYAMSGLLFALGHAPRRAIAVTAPGLLTSLLFVGGSSTRLSLTAFVVATLLTSGVILGNWFPPTRNRDPAAEARQESHD
jgi:hypothetical protein